MSTKKKAEKPSGKVVAYKGFDAQMQCRGYQFKVGETYQHDGPVEPCTSGFHSCENPLDVFRYYEPGTSLFAEVEASGKIERHADDSKVASASLHVKAMLSIPDFIAKAIEWVTGHCTADGSNHATGYRSASSATGDRSASSATGYSSASSATGYRSASSATGDRSASSATGYSSASSATGDRSASSATGDSSASSATGYSSASSATGYRSASSATGYRSASSATGYSSASLTTDWYSRSEVRDVEAGKPTHAVAVAAGGAGKARAPAGSAIVLVERNERDGSIISIAASKVGENGIRPDVWYMLKDGAFVEVRS